MIAAVARHLVDSSLFALIALLVVAYLRHRSASTRHAILLCAVLKFAIPLQLLLSIGAWLRTELPAHTVQVSMSFTLHRTFGSSVPIAAGMPNPLLNILFLSLWIVVAAIFLSVWLRRLFAPIEASGVVPGTAVAALERMKARMAVRRNIGLRISKNNLEPRLYGLLRPTIVMPETLSHRLAEEEFDAVLLHELAHVHRWDNLTRAFVHVMSCIFWFFPMLLWLERRIDMECELACDELVLSSGARPQEYLDGILKVCKSYLQEPVAGSSSVSGSNLKRRMEFIMSFRMRKTNTLSAGVAVCSVFLCLATAAIAAGFSTQAASEAQIEQLGLPKTAVNCLRGKEYPEGTVIKMGKLAEQMCVESFGRPIWVTISDEARKRTRKVIKFPEPPPFICKPTAADGKFCTCKGQGKMVFSFNATVLDAEHRALTCGAHGEWMVPYYFMAPYASPK